MNIEARVVSFVSKIAPWLTTVPTAYAIGHAAYSVIEWPAWVAVVLSVSVETLGIGATTTTLELYSYNRTRRKTDPAAPLALALALNALYFAAVIVLTAVLERSAVLALFPLLSAVASGVMALRVDHAARVADIKSERDRAAQERTRKRQERDASEEQALDVTDVIAEFAGAQRYQHFSEQASAAWRAPAPEISAEPLPPAFEACPKCGRSDFESRFQRSGHVGKCKGARP